MFVAVNSAHDLPLGEPEGGGMVSMRWGRDRSVEEELKATSGDVGEHDVECDDW